MQPWVNQPSSLPVSSYSVPPTYPSNPDTTCWQTFVMLYNQPHGGTTLAEKITQEEKRSKKSQQQSPALSWIPTQVTEQCHKCATLKLLILETSSHKNTPKIKKLITKLKSSPSWITHAVVNKFLKKWLRLLLMPHWEKMKSWSSCCCSQDGKLQAGISICKTRTSD